MNTTQNEASEYAHGQRSDQGQIPLNPEDLESVTCKSCGGKNFDMLVEVKRLSPLNPKSGGQEHFFPLRVLVCKECGHELTNVTF